MSGYCNIPGCENDAANLIMVVSEHGENFQACRCRTHTASYDEMLVGPGPLEVQDLAAIVAQLAELADPKRGTPAITQGVTEVHQPDDDGVCVTCGKPWPCTSGVTDRGILMSAPIIRGETEVLVAGAGTPPKRKEIRDRPR